MTEKELVGVEELKREAEKQKVVVEVNKPKPEKAVKVEKAVKAVKAEKAEKAVKVEKPKTEKPKTEKTEKTEKAEKPKTEKTENAEKPRSKRAERHLDLPDGSEIYNTVAGHEFVSTWNHEDQSFAMDGKIYTSPTTWVKACIVLQKGESYSINGWAAAYIKNKDKRVYLKNL